MITLYSTFKTKCFQYILHVFKSYVFICVPDIIA